MGEIQAVYGIAFVEFGNKIYLQSGSIKMNLLLAGLGVFVPFLIAIHIVSPCCEINPLPPPPEYVFYV